MVQKVISFLTCTPRPVASSFNAIMTSVVPKLNLHIKMSKYIFFSAIFSRNQLDRL